MGTTVLLVVGIVGIAGAMAILAIVLLSGAAQTTGVARSLELINGRPARESDVAVHELPARDRYLLPDLRRTRGLGERLAPNGTAERLALQLAKAGNPEFWSVERLLGAKGAALLLLAVLGLLYGGLSFRGLLIAVVAGAVGFFLPDLLVYNAVLRRSEALRHGLGDAMDMLTVCVEAGQGFDAALLQVARSAKGPIALEFARVLSEVQIGRSRVDALQELGERVDVPEAKTLVTALIQADRLGLPLAGVLRQQSASLREARWQRAEELAQKVPVKIIFPMLLCIFPALFIVILGPGALQIMENLSGLS